MNLFITGANRGIGLAFAHHYLGQGASVWASYRHDLGGLANINSNRLQCVKWDVKQAQPDVTSKTLLPETIDILINNAGIYGPSEQSLEKITSETMLELFDVDCLGVLRVTQFLQSRITKVSGTIANISSKMGSSMDNSSGGCYAYRAAKAALVIVSKSMAIDLANSGAQVITLHPGWVRTEMTNHSGLIDTEQSATGMAQVIANVAQYEPGAFVAFDGKVVPY